MQNMNTRVISMDSPERYTDVLHVYGTNKEADKYNATMLHSLPSNIHALPCTDNRHDHETGQIQVDIVGKKAMKQVA